MSHFRRPLTGPFLFLALGSTPIAQSGIEPVEAVSRAQARTDGFLLTLEPSGEDERLVPVTLEGVVFDADGSLAKGAVVVSSAGGKAVTDGEGWYRLEVELPLEAESVQITAVGAAGKNRLASRSIAVLGSAGRIPTGPLFLGPGSACPPPAWLPTFGAQPGTDAEIEALEVYDDGSGPALYAAGRFTSAGNVAANRIARWDGVSWSPLGSGLNDYVYALAVYDDGGGPKLYAGGRFSTAGGVAANRIASWDGTSWSALGSGTDSIVQTLTVHDDGGGPALHAGGGFQNAGGVPAWYVARWDGATWSALGSGMNNPVEVLTVHDEGDGSRLYAGGLFTSAGGVTANRIARWNGASWAPLGSGIGGINPSVRALASYDDGGGPALYVGGSFTTAGGTAASRIARWNGTSWAPLGSGTDSWVLDLHVYDDGDGPALYAGGQFTSAGGAAANHVARWDGASWSALDDGMSGSVNALAVHEVDGDSVLFAAGGFITAGAAGGKRIAQWRGGNWSALHDGINGRVQAVTTWDDGYGPALYAGGGFTTTGEVAASFIGRWNGSSWSELGGAVDGTVNALAVHDDGSGPALYAGGHFSHADGVEAEFVARWDGAAWSPLGTGINSLVQALTTYDDGGGPALYAGGVFSTSDDGVADRIARWDGTSWSGVGGGTSGGLADVRALAVFHDGGGPVLYAGGDFTTAGGVSANRIARWDGASWSALGSGLNASVEALTVYDDGGGPALYVGGTFTTAGGVSANRIARWDGSNWSALGSGVVGGAGQVLALTMHDDGGGNALFAGGLFTTAGGVAANKIARWDGTSWSALGSGMSGIAPAPVHAMASFDDGAGSALFVGGNFLSAIDSGDSYLARWGRDATAPTLFTPPVFALDSFGGPPGEVVHFSVTTTDNTDPTPEVVCVPPSGSLFPVGTTLVTCRATDACGSQSTSQFLVTVQIKARQR